MNQRHRKFIAKVKVAVLKLRQDWEVSQIKDLKLVIPDDYTFMASNSFLLLVVH